MKTDAVNQQGKGATVGSLDGKVAFISGVARGQGRSHPLRMAEEGADIIGFDLCEQMETVTYPMSAPDDLAETAYPVRETGRRVVCGKADVRDQAAVQRILDTGLAELGRVDIVVANAGIFSGLGLQRGTRKPGLTRSTCCSPAFTTRGTGGRQQHQTPAGPLQQGRRRGREPAAGAAAAGRHVSAGGRHHGCHTPGVRCSSWRESSITRSGGS